MIQKSIEHNQDTEIAKKAKTNSKENLTESTSLSSDIVNQSKTEPEKNINKVKSKKERTEIFVQTEDNSTGLENIKKVNNIKAL